MDYLGEGRLHREEGRTPGEGTAGTQRSVLEAEAIFLTPGWWPRRGDKGWFGWKVRRFREAEKEGSEEAKWGGRIISRLVPSPDPPHEAHCSPGTGPIIWFVSRQIITQLV